MYTIDGYMVDSKISEAVEKEVLNLIYSFEASFKESYTPDERETEQKLQESLIVDKQSKPDTINEVPFMIVYMEKAKQELERIASGWLDVRERLQQSGTYRELKERM